MKFEDIKKRLDAIENESELISHYYRDLQRAYEQGRRDCQEEFYALKEAILEKKKVTSPPLSEAETRGLAKGE